MYKLFLVFTIFILFIAMVFNNANNMPIPRTVFFSTPTKSAIIYYSQKDPRWANIILTCPNGHTSTFTHQGCGETSFAMLMSTFIDLKYTPSEVLDDFYSYIYCGGTKSSYSTNLLIKQGFTVYGPFTNIDLVKGYIKQGWLGWMHVEYQESYGRVGHEVIVTGVDANNNFTVFDSYYGIGTVGDSKFPYNEKNITLFYVIMPPTHK